MVITDSTGNNVYNPVLPYSNNNITDPIVNPVPPPNPNPTPTPTPSNETTLD